MNTFGTLFKISIFGESHGSNVGLVIDGCPVGIDIDVKDFLHDLERRKSGKKGTTPRLEKDLPKIISGTFNGKTTGAPITILFENTNIRSKDYSGLVDTPRPGHADFTAKIKYKGFNDFRGGGHFSGRLTLALVAAGVIAKKILPNTDIKARVIEVGGQKDIQKALDEALENKDSLGAIVECKANKLPIGLGEPFFDSLESLIAHLVFAIPATKGIEFGSGFSSAAMTGSQMNDEFIDKDGKTRSNNSGGINGGISNGNELHFNVAIKPTSSIALSQNTFNFKENKLEELEIKGRHDLCIALRVPPVLEAVTAIALADLFLIRKSQL